MGVMECVRRIVAPRVRGPIFGRAPVIPALSRAACLSEGAAQNLREAYGDLRPPTVDALDLRLAIAERFMKESLEIVSKARATLKGGTRG